MAPKHFFSPFTWYIRGGGIKNKWTTGRPGNIQNYNLQAFLSSKLSTDCGPHILHTQLPLAPALIRIRYQSLCCYGIDIRMNKCCLATRFHLCYRKMLFLFYCKQHTSLFLTKHRKYTDPFVGLGVSVSDCWSWVVDFIHFHNFKFGLVL